MNGISSENLNTTAADIASAGTSTQQSQDTSVQNGETFAGVLSEMIEGQATAQLTAAISGSSSSSDSSLSNLGTSSTNSDTLSSLLTSFSGTEDSASELGVMLLYMLMNMSSGSGSDSGMMMLSSLLSCRNRREQLQHRCPVIPV